LELSTSNLIGSCSITWAMPPTSFFLQLFFP
jgi:hypothetical protein